MEIKKFEEQFKKLTKIAEQQFSLILSQLSYLESKKPKNLTKEDTKILELLNKFSAVCWIGQYQKISMQASRELIAYWYKKDSKGKPILAHLEPSGKESAKILLYSGVDEYQEDFKTKKVRASKNKIRSLMPPELFKC